MATQLGEGFGDVIPAATGQAVDEPIVLEYLGRRIFVVVGRTLANDITPLGLKFEIGSLQTANHIGLSEIIGLEMLLQLVLLIDGYLGK